MGLYWNYFLHIWKIYSYSPFSNASVFVPTAPSITSVTVTPETMSLAQGQAATVQVNAAVVTAGFAPKTVVWSSDDDDVTVDAFGVVTISADAEGDASGQVTITATSTFDSTKTDTCVITLETASGET